MGDRYRYPRSRSPTYNPARASLPINISGWASDHHHDHHEHHLHAVPSSRREVKPIGPRTSVSTVTPGTVTTYKIKADPVRASSRTRRSTLDSGGRPPPIITTNRQLQRPVIHSGGARPESPLRNPYRSSEEDYYSQPASSKHGRYHAKRHSATMDNADMSRLARDSDRDRLRVGPSREGGLYPGSRSRQGPIYPNTSTRRSNVDEYGEEGYGYTGPKDLVQYDLSHNTPRHARSNSIEGGRSRPAFNDFAPRSFDTRERGPPPSTRGFDRIARGQTWDQQQQARAPVAPMDPIQRAAPFEPMDPIRRSNSARPQNMYHDNRDSRRSSKDDYYEVRDDDRHRKSSRQEPYDDAVEQRGFGIRSDRPERSPRSDRPDRDRADRAERTDRPARSERPDRYDRDYPDDDRSDHKGRDNLTAGLGIGSIAGAALGLGAAKTRGDRDDRDDRDDRRRRDHESYDEPRRRRDMDDRDLNETGGRESKDRRYWDDEGGSSSARDGPPPPKISPPRDSRDLRDAPPYGSADPAFLAVGRDSKERPSSRDGNTSGRRERRPRTYDPNGTAIDSLSDTSTAEDGAPRSRRGSHNRRESTNKPAAFNPKDAADLKGLRDAINAKDAAEAAAIPPKIPPKEPLTENRTPRGSLTKDPREVADIRAGLDDRRPREPLQPQDNRQLRVVSPPREKGDFKPVKGILKQSRTAFPEDPDPIREGVAPLKDAKKDGVPPDARWTKIARKLVNPEALELGKERYEAREEFVIVLRVLSREEVQGYAEVTQRIRAAREEDEERERAERHRARRERRERHKREGGASEIPRSERRHRHHRSSRAYDRGSSSESDTTEDEDDDRVRDAPRMLEAPSTRKKPVFDETVMSGGLGDGYLPPVSVASIAGSGSGSGSAGRRDYGK